MKNIRLVIADDHRYLIEGVEMALSGHDIEVVGKAESLGQLEDLLSHVAADILLLDIMFTGSVTGVQFAQKYLAAPDNASPKKPRVKIIMFSQYDETDIVKNAFEVGVRGFLSKNSNPGELIDAINAVYDGGVYLPDGIARRIAVDAVAPEACMADDPRLLLSEREYRIFLRIAAGNTQAEISSELGLALRTVASDVSKCKEKLNMERFAQFTILAMKLDLIDEPV